MVPTRDVEGNVKGWRVCIDPRPLNSMIPSANFPIPIIRDILENRRGASLYSRIDLTAPFNQFQVNEKDRKKTTFTWEGKQYQFVGVPFGFKHIPGTFQRAISNMLKELPFVVVYIDDIIISSHSVEEHLDHIKQALDKLNEKNLKINLD